MFSIKKAYRRKALELHPDRNFGNVEDATIQFAEVQSAYQLLSDPHERAWYDAHREQILRGDDAGDSVHYDHNIKVTTVDELIRLMSRFSASVPFTDAPDGFYGVLRSTFRKLAFEENAACDWALREPIPWPDFGGKDDDYEHVVRPFYTTWASFTTQKTFSWMESYNLNDAPDRRIRRLMEQDNAKAREIGRRDFNDTVQELLSFVKKRDPRYAQNVITADERQKQLREAASAQAARARAANQAKLATQQVSDWTHTTAIEDAVGTFSDSDLSEEEVFECVACGKIFKSEKQYDTHEKSKKHIKTVQHLKRQMEKENAELKLGDDITSPSLQNVHDTAISDDSLFDDEVSAEEQGQDSGSTHYQQKYTVNESVTIPKDEEPRRSTLTITDANRSDSPITDDEYASRKDVIDRLKKTALYDDKRHARSPPQNEEPLETSLSTMSLSSNQDMESPTPRLGRAKAKRAKKAARDDTEAHSCVACSHSFASRNELFLHIKENPQHAKPLPANVNENRGGKKLGRKRNSKQ